MVVRIVVVCIPRARLQRFYVVITGIVITRFLSGVGRLARNRITLLRPVDDVLVFAEGRAERPMCVLRIIAGTFATGGAANEPRNWSRFALVRRSHRLSSPGCEGALAKGF